MIEEISKSDITQSILMLKYGVGAFCVLFTIFILVHVFKFVWEVKTKETKQQKADSALQMAELEEALRANTAMLNLLKKDLSRYYFGMKFLAGEKWPSVRAFIEEDQQKGP